MFNSKELGLTLVLATLGLVGCSPSPTARQASTQIPTSQPSQAVTQTNSAATSATAPYDAKFIDNMVMHHQGAIAMANDALKQAQRPEIKQLAGQIIQAQQAEIQQMQTWRKDWFPDLGETGGTGMSMGMVEVAPGDAPYDVRFIDAMIPHHEGAIAMAEDLKKNSQRPELLKLADDIIQAQTAEIKQMREWHMAWSGKSSTSKGKDEALIEVSPTAMIMGNSLSVDFVRTPIAGWLVIHVVQGDQPGEVVGYVAVPAGESQGIHVTLSKVEPKLMAMLHEDKGKQGQFEFPGDDIPITVDGKPVSMIFATMVH